MRFAILVAVLAYVQMGLATTIHVVAPGEQVGRLAAIYSVSADEILAANPHIQPPLQPGDQIVIPGSSATPTSAPVPNVAVATPVTPPPLAPPTVSNPSLMESIRIPASQGIRYNGRWVPPGETAAWNMDCSNTARWLIRETRGIELPRTASGQYEWLRQKNRLWRVRPNASVLRKKLKPGDLLFWEHTYRPTRKPPVTHVMVYLGTDASGRMMMAGSQGSKGVTTYPFDPKAKMGSYPFFLWFRRDGRFVAYGRP